MSVEKVNYICIDIGCLVEGQNTPLIEIPDVITKVGESLKSDKEWLQIKQRNGRDDTIFYYNRAVRGLFPDLSEKRYTRAMLPVGELYPFGATLAGMQADQIKKKELRIIFPSKREMEPLAQQWNWTEGFLSQYFAVFPYERDGEVCRIDGKPSARWGAPSSEWACLLRFVHLDNYVDGKNWEEDIRFLLNRHFVPVLGKKAGEKVQAALEVLGQSGCTEDILSKLTDGKFLKPENRQQKERIQDTLLLCDNERVSLSPYDASILSPLNGHWDLWQYVQYNKLTADKLPSPPEGKIWVDVSDENIYARNAAEDIAPTAETVAIDFGTKSTAVAWVDAEGYIVTVPVGEYGSKGEIGEKGYENPTILKYINFDSFRAAYQSADGRPETKFNDLSASHTAENGFAARTLTNGNDIFNYQYQIKQWAYDSQFEPLIFDSHRQIKIKSYRDIGQDDFDPIEVYAYMVGLNVVNMKLDKICTRYLLSYPPSYGMDICEKIRASFERGIRKAIPLQAQRAGVFNNAFEVLLWQSEPAAYAVCAIKEFAIARKCGGKEVLCGVYDLGGGTVDYHFGIFQGTTPPPYTYVSLKNGGNPKLGCENILEELAYEVFSLIKDELLDKGIKYEFPQQYPKSLRDVRYTSNSRLAKFNTLGMVNALRELWIGNFEVKEIKSNRLCYFQVYPENHSDRNYYLVIEKDEKNGKTNFSVSQNEKSTELKFFISVEYLRDFFDKRLQTTVREFLSLMKQAKDWQMEPNLKCIIFLAGNGSKSRMVKEIFESYIEEWQIKDCELYPPLSTTEAGEKGQKLEKRKGSIPNAKTGVAHGLLISRPGSNFIEISESNRNFVFKFHLGNGRYQENLNEEVFELVRSADTFKCYERQMPLTPEDFEYPAFSIRKDGYLNFWYTGFSNLSQDITLKECGARQFLIRVPDSIISKEAYEGRRGQCYCRAVSEKELELFIKPENQQIYYTYGILDLVDGEFQIYFSENETVE